MIYQLSQFAFPDDPARLFPDTPGRDLYLEIGFGDGRFWPRHAATFAQPPNYLGAEISGSSLQKAQARLRKLGLTNAHLTKLPATVLLAAVIPPASLDAVIVNFPDPWAGGWWRLRDIVDYELICARSILTLAARYRLDFQKNYRAMAADQEREADAKVWIDALAKDMADEAR